MWKIVLAFILFIVVMSAGRTEELKVNYIKLSKFKESEIVKIKKSAKIIEKILNSQEFKDRVLNYTFSGKRQFVDAGMSNANVYNTFIRGAELAYMPVPNGYMDIGLEMYYSPTNTVGYTYDGSDTVWLNRKFHNRYDEYTQPSNIVHEWAHKLGFKHSYEWKMERDFSVPYGVGSIVSELAEMLRQNPNALTKISVRPIPEIILDEIEVPSEPEKKCYRSWRTLFFLVCK